MMTIMSDHERSRKTIVSGKTKPTDGGEARDWADRLVEESESRIEKWRGLAETPATGAVSKEEAEKTHAVMLSVLELMQLHRASLLEMVQRGAQSEDFG